MYLGNTRDCPHMKYGTGDTPLWNGIEYSSGMEYSAAVEWNRAQKWNGIEYSSGME